MCDEEGPTLTIIKSHYDKVFGGFTDIPWKSSGAAEKSNGNTFLFTINKNDTIHKLKCIPGKTEVFHRENQLTFGSSTIYIEDSDLRNQSCKTFLGEGEFEVPKHANKDTYLAGAK